MTLEQAALRLYRALIRAFPEEFQLAHGTDLANVTEEALSDSIRQRGRRRLILFVPRLFLDLLVRLLVEHWHDAARDSHHAIRLLARAPGFTVAAVTCLTIGTGLTAAMYAQVQSTMLAEIPGGVLDPNALVRIQKPAAYPVYEDLRDETDRVVRLAGYMGPIPLALAGEDRSESIRVWGHLATPDYFEVLGIQAARGRLFGPEERVAGAGSVAVIGDRLWRSRFGGEASIVGQSVRVNGQPVTVIGVTPPGFAGASPMTAAADLWMPTTAAVQIAPELSALRDRRQANTEIVGRLRPGTSHAQAELVLEAAARRMEVRYGDPGRDSDEPRIRLVPGGRMFPVRTEDLPRTIGFPLVLVSLVLVMACGNVANMVLARGASRHREFALRLALGAGRGRIVRQLITESLILSVMGSIGGALLARWLLSLFARMRPIIPDYVQYDVHFSWGAFAVAALAASASTVLFSLSPALRASRLDIQAGLKPNASLSLHGRRRFGLRNLVIYQQVTVSVVLVLLTGFVVVGWRRAANVNVGFNPEQLYFLSVDPVRDGRSAEEAALLIERLRTRLQTAHVVVAVGVAQTVPLALSGAELVMNARADLASGMASLGAVRADRVGAGFLETIGVSILHGRGFTAADHRDESRVVVVNETMARRAWPESDALGQPLTLGNETWQVVGVVGDMRSAFPLAPTLPAVYQPVTPAGFATPSRNGVTLAVRIVPGLDGSVVLAREVKSVDPNLTVVRVKRMTQEVEQALFLARAATVVYGGMGVLGLVLASVGLAGVTAYAVARRTRELGIRMALGAQRAQVLWLVLREGAIIVVAGTVTGVGLALALTRALSGVVEAFGETTRMSVSDPRLLIGGPALLVVLGLIACYLPARRSTQIDPIAALRAE